MRFLVLLQLLLLACVEHVAPKAPLAGDCQGPACLARADELAHGQHPDAEAAARLYSQLCDQDQAIACAHLADLNDDDRIAGASHERALELARKACDLGRGASCSLAGFIQSLDGHDQEARISWQRGCDADDAISCSNLVTLMAEGSDDRKRLEARTMSLVRSKCSAGAARECEFLGQMLLGQDRAAEAAGPLGIACTSGDDLACAMLGWTLMKGVAGLPVDPARGQAILEGGCKGGGAISCSRLSVVLMGLKDTAGARATSARACELGSGEGCYLSALYEVGGNPLASGLAPEALHAANRDARRSCTLRYPGGCALAGQNLRLGTGVPVDLVASRTLLDRACQLEVVCQDHACDDLAAQACNIAGTMWEGGVGGPGEVKTAGERYTEACRLDNDAGCQNASRLGR
jgi:TPR repeat protein